MTSLIASSSRSSIDRLKPILQRNRQRYKTPTSTLSASQEDDIWPADDTIHSYHVGATKRSTEDVYVPPPARKFGKVKSKQSLTGGGAAKRLGSHYLGQGRVSAVFTRKNYGLGRDHGIRRVQSRRSISEVEKDEFADAKAETSCYSIAMADADERRGKGDQFGKGDVYKRGDFVEGYCRMAWFAGLRCTRFLRLVQGKLHCFDSGLRKKLWVVRLDGAKVRVHPAQNKIVLSKLQNGHLLEFFLCNANSCQDWGAALLRASMPQFNRKVSERHHGGNEVGEGWELLH